MHKYFFEGKVHTAQDFYEAQVRTGIKFPHPFHSFSYYLVRLWQWDTPDADYTVEILNEPGHQIFNKYDEALNCFKNLDEKLPGFIQEDVKLALVHYHLGAIYPLECRILMSPVFTGEC